MEVLAILSAAIGVVGTLGGLWFALRAEKRARAADARAAEAHALARAAHRMAVARDLRDAAELRREAFVSGLIEQAYLRAAGDPGAGLAGVVLSADLSADERSAVLALKGDPRVADVTLDADGTLRVWVDGSGFPNERQGIFAAQ